MNPIDKPDPSDTLAPDSVRLSLQGRPLLLFLLIGTAILLSSLFAVASLSRLNVQMDEVVQRVSDRTKVLSRIRQSMLSMRVQEKNFMSWSDEDQLRDFNDRLRVAEAELDMGLRELEAVTNEEVAEEVALFRKQYDDFRGKVERVAELGRSDTLRQAIALSRGRGRDLYEQARLIFLSFLERNRALIAQAATSGGADVPEMTSRASRARTALELLHDLLYLEQAALTPLDPDDRVSLIAQLASKEKEIAQTIELLAGSPVEQDRVDMQRLGPVLEQWIENSNQVRRLALDDSRAAAMKLSTTVVRQSYIDSANMLDALLQQAEKQMLAARSSHEQTLSFGRIIVLTCGLLGVGVVGGLLVLLVQQITRDYRRAAAPFVSDR